MMNARTLMNCGAAALALLGVCAAPVAQAASLQAILPTPGLYQIDSDASHSMLGGLIKNEQQVDASGTIRSRTVADGRGSDLPAVSGEPNRRCVQPRRDDGRGVVAQLANLQRCPKQSQQFVGKNKLVHSAQCPDGNVTLTITKVDGNIWEFETRHELTKVGGTVDLGYLRPALEHKARNGATAAERAEAAEHLKRLPAAQKELESSRAQQRAALENALEKAESPEERAMIQRAMAATGPQGRATAPGENVMVARERWTRVANQCTGQRNARR